MNRIKQDSKTKASDCNVGVLPKTNQKELFCMCGITEKCRA